MDILGRILYATWVTITLFGTAIFFGITVSLCVSETNHEPKEIRRYLSSFVATILAILTAIYLSHVVPRTH